MTDACGPATPRAAATILILRDDPLEVLMVRRHGHGPFASALVFPGGLVDPSDSDPRWLPLLDGGESLAVDDRALAVAAFRETFEETGLLLTRPCPGGAALPVDQSVNGFRAVVAASGGRLPVDALVPFGHWITPESSPKRFDTHFFVAPAPHGQEPVCDGDETVALEWVRPQILLDRAAAGDRSILFPTRLNLKRLAESVDVGSAIAAARARPRFTVVPVTERRAGGIAVTIPAAAGYGETENFHPDLLPRGLKDSTMTILLDEQQQAIAAEAQRVLAARTSTERLKELLERNGDYDEVFWNICREQGWTAIGIPEESGGIGLGLVELGLIAEACGAQACGAPFLATGFGVAQALLRHGDAATQREWLPKLAAGDAIGVIAFAEGADMIPAPAALRCSNGRLTGVKPAVSGGAAADVAVVLAEGEHGAALALVALDQPGVAVATVDTFDNSRCTADLRFDEAAAIVLDAPDAAAAALDILSRQAVVTAHEQIGGAARMMNAARDYAMTRRAFGQPIAAFQTVKHRIAEDYVLIELARANALQAAASDGSPAFLRNAAAARLSATEAYDTVARDATQVHGGIGVTWESDLHLHQRRSRSLAIEQGPMLFWEDVLVGLLAGEAA